MPTQIKGTDKIPRTINLGLVASFKSWLKVRLLASSYEHFGRVSYDGNEAEVVLAWR